MSKEFKFNNSKPGAATTVVSDPSTKLGTFRLCCNVEKELRNRLKGLAGKHDCLMQLIVADAVEDIVKRMEESDQKGTFYQDFDVTKYRIPR